MKILVCGSRIYSEVTKIRRCIEKCLLEARSDCDRLVVVHGGARGADTICDRVCRELGVRRIVVHAEWKKYGRKAGYIRNQQMLDAHPDIDRVYAFMVGKNSYGTQDMISRTKKKGIPVHLESAWDFESEKLYKLQSTLQELHFARRHRPSITKQQSSCPTGRTNQSLFQD